MNEDLRKLTPVDIYDFFDVNEVEELVNIISENSDSISISDSADLRQ